MKVAFRIFWSRVMERTLRVVLSVVAKVPKPSVSWRRLEGPYFGNELAEFVAEDRHAHTVLRKSARTSDERELTEVARVELSA